MAIPNHIKNNLSIPVIGSPLFLVSGPELVIAQCKAGIIGSFPALNARPQHVLGEWITRIKAELAEYQEQNPDKKVAPFAVNQICHGSNDRPIIRSMTYLVNRKWSNFFVRILLLILSQFGFNSCDPFTQNMLRSSI